MEASKEELQRNKERDEKRSKEIAQLKLEGNKREVEFKRWKDDAASKAVRQTDSIQVMIPQRCFVIAAPALPQ